jgi:hypothetical protein
MVAIATTRAQVRKAWQHISLNVNVRDGRDNILASTLTFSLNNQQELLWL